MATPPDPGPSPYLRGPATPFGELATAVLDDWAAVHPAEATEQGDHRFDDRLPDLSVDGTDTEARTWSERLQELDAVDLDELTTEEQVDLEVLRGRLTGRLLELETLRRPDVDPLVHNPGGALFALLARETSPLPDRLRGLAGRLEAVPDVTAAAEERLDEVARVHAETAVAQLDGTITLVEDEVARLLAERGGEVGGDLVDRVARARERALEALRRHRAWTAEELLPRADADPRLGAPRFAAALWATLDTPLAPEDVVALAREELAASTEALADVCRRLDGPGSRGEDDADVVRRVLARLGEDAPDASTVVAEAERALTGITDAVRESDLVTVPDDPVRVLAMPEFQRGVAVAHCQAPGPLEPGGETFLAIAPPPAGWSAERRASFWREYHRAALVTLMVHEGVPGHALQLAHARRLRSSVPVRAVFWSGTFVEGWAVEVERVLAEELGHGGLAVRAAQLKMRLRVAANALLDAGVHAEGWTEEQGCDLLVGSAFQEEGEAVGKWRRALLTSAQLSTYFVGQAEVAALRRDLRAARPGASARSLHDALLAHGSPPPRLLRVLLDLPPDATSGTL